jgi:hypothetical protein
MKYKNGDLMVDFELRVFRKLKEPLKTFNWIRLATPGEKIIFDRNFKETATFEEFKKKMPAFDSRRIKGVIYDHIPLYEDHYIFIKSMKVNTNYNVTLFEDKLAFLINTWELNQINPLNALTKKQNLDQLKDSIHVLVDKMLTNFLPEILSNNQAK